MFGYLTAYSPPFLLIERPRIQTGKCPSEVDSRYSCGNDSNAPVNRRHCDKSFMIKNEALTSFNFEHANGIKHGNRYHFLLNHGKVASVRGSVVRMCGSKRILPPIHSVLPCRRKCANRHRSIVAAGRASCAWDCVDTHTRFSLAA